MSGLAGICRIDGDHADPALLRRVSDALAHGGRETAGHRTEGAIALAHPVATFDDGSWLVWDGRLDNGRELLGALGAPEPRRETVTDAEVALSAHRAWGVGCLERLRGDFAFAAWDARARRLLCARDPIGITPFYYHWDGRRLLFASAPRAIFADPDVARRPDEATIADYLLDAFRDPEATFFEGVRRLSPAHALTLGPGGLRRWRYWDIDPCRRIRYPSDDDYVDRFRELLIDAVRVRVRDARRVGLLLSGGIDSTALATVAMSLGPDAPSLAAFTCLAEGFLDEEWDAVRRVAETPGVELYTIGAGGADAAPTPFELGIPSEDGPQYDGFPVEPLAHVARRDCRVALTGFGADELFYARELGSLADLLTRGRWIELVRQTRRLTVAYGGVHTSETLASLGWLARTRVSPRLRRLVKKLAGRQLPAWIDASFARRAGLGSPPASPEPPRFDSLAHEESYGALTAPAMAFALDRVHAAAADAGVECRHPYLDRPLIEFLFATPPEVILAVGYRKQFLQRAVARLLPGPPRTRHGSEIAASSVSPERIARAEATRILGVLSSPGARVRRYIDRAEIERLCARYVGGQRSCRSLLWRFVALERWLASAFRDSACFQGDAA